MCLKGSSMCLKGSSKDAFMAAQWYAQAQA
jgi:hypothetical protein